MQRLTKYPLLIENLIKYTPAETEEYSRLQAALGYSREILLFVNKTVNDYQNQLKLAEIERKLDTRPMENSLDVSLKEYKNLNMSDHVLLHDGLLLWRIRRDRVIPIHVVLLDSLLLLLQKQDDKLILRCEQTVTPIAGKEDRRKLTHSPVIRLTNVLVRLVATDKFAFFLINASDSGSQIYELIASSKDEKNRWCKYIDNAVEAIGRQKNLIFPAPHIPMPPTYRTAETDSAEPSRVIPERHEGLGAIYDEDEDGAEQRTSTDHKIDDETSGLHRNEVSDFEGSIDSNSSVDPIELLKQIDDVIRQKMYERMKIWSQLWHEYDTDDDRSELFKDPSVRKHLFQILIEANQMMCLVSNQCTAEGSKTTAACSPALCDTPQPDTDKALHCGDGVAVSMLEGFQVSFPLSQIVELNNSIQKHLMLILESVMRTDEERQKLYLDLQSVQRKIALLNLSCSHSQHAESALNQTLEPVSETAEDFYGTTDVSVSSDSKPFDSEPVGDYISCANQIDSKITTDDVSANEISDVTDISLTLDSEFSDIASSTDA